jgi:hypothetical protein
MRTASRARPLIRSKPICNANPSFRAGGRCCRCSIICRSVIGTPLGAEAELQVHGNPALTILRMQLGEILQLLVKRRRHAGALLHRTG